MSGIVREAAKLALAVMQQIILESFAAL